MSFSSRFGTFSFQWKSRFIFWKVSWGAVNIKQMPLSPDLCNMFPLPSFGFFFLGYVTREVSSQVQRLSGNLHIPLEDKEDSGSHGRF